MDNNRDRLGRCVALAATLMLVIAPFAEGADDGVLFYAPLDGDLKAQTANGSPDPVEAPDEPQFVEGRNGQGLLTGAPGSVVRYAVKDNLNADRGSVSLWIMPRGWEADPYIRTFWHLTGDPDSSDDGSVLSVYGYRYAAPWAYIRQRLPARLLRFVQPKDTPFEWKAGQWVHLIVSWSGDQFSFYLNGEYAGSEYAATPSVMAHPDRAFNLGGKNQRNGGTADTVLDDLIVFDRPMTPALAKAVHEDGREGWRSALADSESTITSLNGGYLAGEQHFSIRPTIVGMTPDELAQTRFGYTVRAEDAAADAEPVLEGTATIERFSAPVKIDARSIEAGEYRIELTLMQNGTSIASTETSASKFERPDWLGNDIGEVSEVPKPWEPIETQKRAANIWGRTYSWDADGLLAQAVTQGEPMLTRPVTMHAEIDGSEHTLRDVQFTWGEGDTVKRAFILQGKLGSFDVRADGWLAYDGLIWYEIAVDASNADASVSIESLSIEIAQRPERATLMNGKSPVSTHGDGGKVKAVQGRIDTDPVYWLGDEQGGVQWSIADTRDWMLNNTNRMVALQPDEDEVVWRIQLIDHAVPVNETLNYTFGLNATPVKPMPEGWRQWEQKLMRITTGADHDEPGWSLWWPNWNALPSGKLRYGHMGTSERTLPSLQRVNENNVRPWIYWNQADFWTADPILKTFGAEWGASYDPEGGIPHLPHIPSLIDYKVWQIEQLLANNPTLAEGIAGLYLDTTKPYWVAAHEFANGEVGPWNTLMGRRNVQRRVYQLLATRWPDLLMCNHESGSPHMSQLAFADIYITGEHLASTLADHEDYYDFLTYAEFRAAYNGRSLGIPVLFLPQLERANKNNDALVEKILGPEGVPAAEHLVGMLWVHDVIIWPAYLNEKPVKQAFRAKADFGYDGIDFHGYWENSELVRQRTDNEKVRTSLYTRPGRAMFVVMNDSDEAATVTLTPDWSELGVHAEQLRDLYAAHADEGGDEAPSVQLGGDAVTFEVPARNFRALATPKP